MKKIALLLADYFDDNELFYPYYRLQEEGYQVDLIGHEKGASHFSKKGQTATVDLSAAEVNPADYEGMIIPGGFSPDHMRRSEGMKAFARAINQQNKPIGAICHGAWMMIATCDLKGRTMTCYHSIRIDIENAGAIFVDEPVVVDGNFVTSRTPKDLPVFVKTFIAQLNN